MYALILRLDNKHEVNLALFRTLLLPDCQTNEAQQSSYNHHEVMEDGF